MSSSNREAFIQELKGAGLSPDQIFQIVMESEKTNQKQQELNRLSPDQTFQLLMEKEKTYQKQLEFEDHSKKRKFNAQSSLPECDTPSSKKVCNQSIHRKSLHDLCADELLTIFDFIPDCGAFKLASVSKQFNQVVLNNIKRVHLVNHELDTDFFKRFFKARCFQNIESLIIDFDIDSQLAKKILKKSDNLRELKMYISNYDTISFSEYPDSSFKKLETLDLALGDMCTVKLDHINLFNLTNLKIENVKFDDIDTLDYLNERVNNITKLYLKNGFIDTVVPKMKALKHLTIEECDCNETGLRSLLVDTLEYVSISTIEYIGPKEELDSQQLELPNLKILSILDSGEFDFTTLFTSKLPNLSDLKLDTLTESYSTALSENSSISSLKKLSIENNAEQGALEKLMGSKTLFKGIESICIDVVGNLDTDILLYMHKNASMFSNLKVLLLLFDMGGLNGYQSFFTSEHFKNLEQLQISAPSCIEDLNYLAQTTCLPNLKILHVIGTTEKPPENFFSLFSNNTNFNQLTELGLSFFDDSSISQVRLMENLKTIRVLKSKTTAWGFKKLEEWGVTWSLLDDIYIIEVNSK